MEDLAKRTLAFASGVMAGLVFVGVGLSLFSSEEFYYYRQLGLLLVPAGLFTIAVAVRWHLQPIVKNLTIGPTARTFLLLTLTVGFLSWGSFSLWHGNILWMAGLMLGLASLAMLLKTLTKARRAPTLLESERLRADLDKASARPLGITLLAGLTASDGVSTVVIAVLFILFSIGNGVTSFLSPIGLITIVVWPFYGVLKTWVAFGFANGSRWSWYTALIQNSMFLALMLVSILIWPFLVFFLVNPFAMLLQNYLLIVTAAVGFSIFTLIYLATPAIERFFEINPGQTRILRTD